MEDSIKYYSQFNQDKWLIKNVFKNKRNGFFIDCGCGHYQNLSNTYSLETYFDWRGIGIDIDQNLVDSFNKNRKSIAVQSVLSDVSGKEVNIILGGATTGIDDDHSCPWIKINKRNKNQILSMITSTLTDVLISNNIQRNIDFFSLDVEGHELQVLKGLDFELFNIDVICLESPWTSVENEKEQIKVFQNDIILFLEKYNYKKISVDFPSDWVFIKYE
jgi:hypothetical protein